jgi:MoxR-like ATPase
MDAAMDAAWAAAMDAARAAAWDAVQKQVGPEQMYSVAYDPVHAFLAPTEKRLQEEAHALYLRMINEKLDEAATADRVETD